MARQAVLAASLGIFLACCVQTPTLALEPPNDVQISSALAKELPAYWAIEAIEISASVKEGLNKSVLP